MTERERIALQRAFLDAGIREGDVGTCQCGGEARYWIDDTEPPRPVCLEHAETHARKWKVDQLFSILSNGAPKKKLTNSELLERQRISLEPVHPSERWGICACFAVAPFRISRRAPEPRWIFNAPSSDPPIWVCREHASEYAHTWELRLEQWVWEPIVAEWVLGPFIGDEDEPTEFSKSKVRLIRCPNGFEPEDVGLSWPDGTSPVQCASCSTPIGYTEDIQRQSGIARAAGEKVFFMCSDCTGTAAIVLQFLRWKGKREAHGWVLNHLKEDTGLRDRWQEMKDFVKREIWDGTDSPLHSVR